MPLDLIVLNERQCYCLIILKCHFKDIAAIRNDNFQCGIDGFKRIIQIAIPLFAYKEIHENIFGYLRI